VFPKTCRKASIDNFKFHDLRHTFASRLVKKGVDLATVRELMGHSSITTTQRYLHSQAREKMAAVNTLAGQGDNFGPQCQFGVKSDTEKQYPSAVIPSYTSNYEGFKGL
jgi:hypothetical protein